MPATLEGQLVVAISSRALFDFEDENRLFEAGDAPAYMQLQLQRLDLPASRPIAEQRDRDLARLADSLARWELVPTGTEGWRKAEVTAGGVDTRELDSRTMESRRIPGLYFIGEVVDVTGWLGGYNFQWAWASAAACAQACRAP